MTFLEDAFHPELFARQLSRAVAQGAALAGLAGFAGCSAEPPPEQPPTAPANLTPYELSGLGCWGPHHGPPDGGLGFYGQCCVDAHCYTPPRGERCLPADQVNRDVLAAYPPGAGGNCACHASEGAPHVAAGPYAPNSAHTPQTPGKCCYLVGRITCDGRPLIVNGEPLLAELTARSDWAPFA